MFDRNIEPMNTLYLGLRAWKLSAAKKRDVKKDADSEPGSANLGADKDAYFFQIMPFSSRKAYLCQHVKNEVAKAIAEFERTENRNATDAEKAKLSDEVKVRINATTVSHKRGEKKSRFDDDIFDAVRTRDLKNMVGAWTVGRVN